MMTTFRRFLASGREFKGLDLMRALEAAASPPRVGRGLQIVSHGPYSAISQKKRQIIPKVKLLTFEAVIASAMTGTATRPGTATSPGRWTYEVDPVQVSLTEADGYEVIDPGADPLNAYNRVELQNTFATTGIQGYGIDLDQPSEASITIIPIRAGSVVQVTKNTTATGGAIYWFSADNPLEVSCQ